MRIQAEANPEGQSWNFAGVFRLGACIPDSPRRVTTRRNGKARPEGPSPRGMSHSLHAEAHRAKRQGLQGQAELLDMFILSGNGSELRGLRHRIWRGPIYRAKGCFPENQYVMLSSIGHLRVFLQHKTVLPPCHVSMPCIIAEKAQKMAYFLQTGSRNMAKTFAINLSYSTSYSTSIPIAGLSALLLPFLMGVCLGLENFAQNRQCHFCIVFLFLITRYRKTRKPRETIFDSLVGWLVMYWYSSKHLFNSIYYGAWWHCKLHFEE